MPPAIYQTSDEASKHGGVSVCLRPRQARLVARLWELTDARPNAAAYMVGVIAEAAVRQLELEMRIGHRLRVRMGVPDRMLPRR